MGTKKRDNFLDKLKTNIERGVLSHSEDLEKLTQLGKLDIEDRLFLSILLSPIEVVEDLLNLGADPNATNKEGTTLLHLALALDRKDIAILLLEYGAVPTSTQKKLKF